MKVLVILIIILHIKYECMSNSTENQCLNLKTDVGALKKRRHLTFPDSSNFVMTISLVKAFMTHAPSGWNIALEIDVPYPLPDDQYINRYFRRKLHHKQKRELWERIHSALDFYNMNGRSCIIQAICESKRQLLSPGKSLVHDLLRVVFTASEDDEEFKEEMNGYYDFSEPDFCNLANDCPFSLLDFVWALNKV